MKDVAAVAGVSLCTVSRVVNGFPPVAPELAAKVERAVEVLGYRHNHTAGTLRRANGRSRTLGLIIEDVSNPFFSAVHRGIEEVARTRGVITFASSSDEDPQLEHDLIEAVLARRVDGLIVVPTASDHTYLLRDVANGLGLVFVDRPAPSIDADAVLSDNRGGAQRAVEHLIAHGHRRIAYIGPPPILFTAVERFAGYRAALHLGGLAELVRHCVEPRRRARGGRRAARARPTRRPRSSPPRTWSRSRRCARCTRPAASTRSRTSASTTSRSPPPSTRR